MLENKKHTAKFLSDLKQGHARENEFISIMEANWNCKCESTQANGSDTRYDVAVRFLDGSNEDFTAEIKEVKQERFTGNVAIELGRTAYGNWRDTGLTATKADIWVIYFDNCFHLMETAKLKLLLEKTPHAETWGGDGMRAWNALLPAKLIREHSDILTKIK